MITSTGPDPPQQTAEKKLAQEFLTILQRHHKDIRRATSFSADANDTGGISVPERKILSRTSYQNWTLGATAGAVTFGVLVGITLRSAAAAARYRLPRRAPSAYRDLDAVSAGSAAASKRASRNQSQPRDAPSLKVQVGQPNEAMDPTSLKSEVMSQVQLMVYGATAMVVSVLTSWYFADRNGFYRQVGRLPLTPGRSQLCRAACPDLVAHYRSLLASHESLLGNPETIELNSMLQLVLNCQQRSQLEADIRHRENLPSDQLVDVPQPGVPFNYLGIPVPSNDQDNASAALQHNGTDEIVNEYDWLRRLVLDQKS